jgi:hypothetical protein
MSPQRIQRKRTKGWRMPEGAVYVGRPSRWGNPFAVMNAHRQGWLVWDDRDRFGFVTHTTSDGYIASFPTQAEAAAFAVKQYRKFMFRQWDLTPLVGRDLACWCPLDRPCHADVLLRLANGGAA